MQTTLRLVEHLCDPEITVGVGDDPSKLHIVVRGDERGPSRGVNEVVRALAKLRVTHVRIAVQTGN